MTQRLFVLPSAAMLGLLALGAAACGSSASTHAATATSSAATSKAALCASEVMIHKVLATVTSPAGFITVLKDNRSGLDTINRNAPAGRVGSEVKALVSAANSAVATNSPIPLSTPSLSTAGAAVDTYCGIDVTGNPLPADFGAGKANAFCTVDTQISAGTAAAADVNGVLAFLKAHQSLGAQFAADVSMLPSSLQPEAQNLVTTSRSAVATNNGAALGTPTIAKDSSDVDLYCGINH